MISVTGIYYDGKTSKADTATFNVYDGGDIRVERKEDRSLIASPDLSRLKFSSRLANTPRYIYFPDGAQFETDDNISVDKILTKFKRHSWLNIVHLLESHKRYVFIALLILILFIWGGVKYAVPMISKSIAYRLPISALGYASNQTLSFLDKSILKPSEIDHNEQTKLLSHFQNVVDNHTDLQLTILFRKGGSIGPNAFALPNGTIIFTDEMIHIAEHDDELLSVFVHEIGHVVNRHGIRTVIQDSLLGFALLAMTGDVAGSSELFLGLPVLLTEMAYSRDFEREADQYALAWLRNNSISTVHFARLMERIDQKMESLLEDSDKNWLSYLSTHPMIKERIKSFKEGTGESISSE